AASDGDTIIVAAGTYQENVVINKSLTLEGAQASVDARNRNGPETIIEPDDGRGIEIVSAADRVIVIDGLTVQNVRTGIAAPTLVGTYDINNITVKYVRVLNCNKGGITLAYASIVAVEYCYVEGTEFGINAGALKPSDPTVANFKHNEVANAEFGITGYLKDSLIEDNLIRNFATGGTGISGQFLNTTIKNNSVTDYARGAAMSFESHYGRDLSEAVNVTGNTFTENRYGIYVFDTQTTLTGITVNLNNIAGNFWYGVRNEGSETLDADKNWWGAARGPGGKGPGDGDAITSKVLYSPWLGAELGTEPMTWGVDRNSLIQDAIDAADPCDTVIVAAGEYGEDLNIDKSLTLQSAHGYEVTTIAGSVGIQLHAGIVFFGGNHTGFTVDADGGNFAVWLSINNGSEITISHNILTGAADGITTRSGLLDNSDLTINDNRIRENDHGIYLESATGSSTVLVKSNSLAANDNYGLYVKNSTVIIDATHNWWGHASGPSGGVADPITSWIANGTGVAVSENVHFHPWSTAYICTLEISSTGGGSVIKPGEGTFTYDVGKAVELIAMPGGLFYGFDKWTGDVHAIVNVNAPVTNITMNDDYSITAEFNFGPFGWCFIATAAYGTNTAKELNILREFRDTVLLPNSLGAKSVSLYYKISPPIANFVSQHEVLRTVVRVGFVDPIVKILTWTHDLWSATG
ncbi:MAG: right-handed parallel beta-helix repeat-containing protein, partial [Dehalococcoidia bacterium]|nr:right-handed parallel beta-helix repeat-containing protein [Dehalococcoidia bacterium]